MFKDYPDVMTPAEVARPLGIGKASVYRLIHEKRLGCKYIGRKMLIPKACLVDFVQSARYTVANP